MAEYEGPDCPRCGVRACCSEPGEKEPPEFCPMPAEAPLLEAVERTYLEREDILELARASARTEAGGYGKLTRIEEIVDFARRLGARRLGIAHCVGLMEEARKARDIFRALADAWEGE